MPDKKNQLSGRQYGVSLHTKICLGFLLAVLPLFFIVGGTYVSLTHIALENGTRQMVVISRSSQEKLNAFIKTSHRFFREWAARGVFRPEDPRDQMDAVQKVHGAFPVMLMLDNHGVIIREHRRFNSHNTPMTGEKVPYFDKVADEGRGRAFVVNGSAMLSAPGGSSFLVLVHRTRDAAGHVSGYFLGFLDLSALETISRDILDALSLAALPGSHVAVVDIMSGERICREAGEDGKLPVPVQKLVARSGPGQINLFDTRQGDMHLVYLPLDVGAGGGTEANSRSPLYLIIGVKEKEMMAAVSGPLMLIMGIAGIGLLFALAVSVLTAKIVTAPINGLVQVLQTYAAGDASARAGVQSRDEIGYFAREFNAMLGKIAHYSLALQARETRYRNLFENLQKAVASKNYDYRFNLRHNDADDLVEPLNLMMEALGKADVKRREEDWIKTGLNQLSEQISGNYKLAELGQKAVSFIARYMAALTGTIFVRRQDNEGTFFELLAAYAYPRGKDMPIRYREKEGLLGQVAKDKKRLHLKDIPDKYLNISSSLGSGAPAEVLIFPLIYEGTVQGVVELGSNSHLEKKHLDLADQLGRALGVAVYSAIVNDQFKKQSEDLLRQQEELKRANRQLEAHNLILQETEPDACH